MHEHIVPVLFPVLFIVLRRVQPIENLAQKQTQPAQHTFLLRCFGAGGQNLGCHIPGGLGCFVIKCGLLFLHLLLQLGLPGQLRVDCRVGCRCPLVGSPQQKPQCTGRQPLEKGLVRLVIHQLVPAEQHQPRSRQPQALGTLLHTAFLQRIGDAPFPAGAAGLAGKAVGQKRHCDQIVVQQHPGQKAVICLKLLAQPAVHGPVALELLHFHLRFLRGDISEHPAVSFPRFVWNPGQIFWQHRMLPYSGIMRYCTRLSYNILSRFTTRMRRFPTKFQKNLQRKTPDLAGV